MNDLFSGIAGICIILCLTVVPVVAWFTHVITCLGTEAWGFLVAGAVFFPIGVVHGVGIWFGVW